MCGDDVFYDCYLSTCDKLQVVTSATELFPLLICDDVIQRYCTSSTYCRDCIRV